MPGPGKYDIKSQFIPNMPPPIAEDEPVVHAPFGSQAKVRMIGSVKQIRHHHHPVVSQFQTCHPPITEDEPVVHAPFGSQAKAG